MQRYILDIIYPFYKIRIKIYSSTLISNKINLLYDKIPFTNCLTRIFLKSFNLMGNDMRL